MMKAFSKLHNRLSKAVDGFPGLTKIHRPLGKDEIRLLILLPGEYDDPISCRLKHAELGKANCYYALSYVWGDPKNTVPIYLNHVSYPITENLDAALRRIRHQKEVMTVWVDAVCINQGDVKERSDQVDRMRDIYKEATGTVIWLGEVAPHTEDKVARAFAHLSLISRTRRTKKALSKGEFIDGYNIHGPVVFELIHRPWFSRVWVIQEATVGRRMPQLLCGPLVIGLTVFADAATDLQEWMNPPSYSLSGKVHPKIRNVRDFRDSYRGVCAHQMLLKKPMEQLAIYLSRSSQGYEASEERDKIYGLVGLLPAGTLPATLRPNYTYSVERVFLEYAVYVLRETKCLDLLSCRSGSNASLPSWVPDWRCGHEFPLGNHRGTHLEFLESDKKIEVDCMPLSLVKRVMPPLSTKVSFPDFPRIRRDVRNRCIVADDYIAYQYALEQLFLAISSLIRYAEQQLFGCRARDAKLSPGQLRNWIRTLVGPEDDSSTADTKRLSNSEAYEILMNRGLDKIRQHSGRIADFCVTSKGSLEARLCEDEHGNMERVRANHVLPMTGDMICYLKGSVLPFLLRPENGEWRLIGTLWGLMPGLSSYEASEEELDICDAFWEQNKDKTERIIIH